MNTIQLKYAFGKWTDENISAGFDFQRCQLVLAFGNKDVLNEEGIYPFLKEKFPNADIVLSSTSGEIRGTRVYDNSVIVSGLQFEKTKVRCMQTMLSDHKDSFETGKFLMKELQEDKLAGVLIFSDGIHINGSELVQGLNSLNLKNIPVTGGLAGDGSNFKATITGLNSRGLEKSVIGVGLYGDDLLIGHGSFGGWDEFGHERTISKANKNVLFELDGKNALTIYKEYLGAYSNELPGSALLFPLSLRIKDKKESLVRTILAIDESENSMTFAGNLPEGSKVRLMKANFDKLIDGSSIAAKFTSVKSEKPQFALLISCVGRKLILQERTVEEVEAASEILGKNCCIAGFYSYGEISPFNPSVHCELHNQTMTITTLAEK